MICDVLVLSAMSLSNGSFVSSGAGPGNVGGVLSPEDPPPDPPPPVNPPSPPSIPLDEYQELLRRFEELSVTNKLLTAHIVDMSNKLGSVSLTLTNITVRLDGLLATIREQDRRSRLVRVGAGYLVRFVEEGKLFDCYSPIFSVSSNYCVVVRLPSEKLPKKGGISIGVKNSGGYYEERSKVTEVRYLKAKDSNGHNTDIAVCILEKNRFLEETIKDQGVLSLGTNTAQADDNYYLFKASTGANYGQVAPGSRGRLTAIGWSVSRDGEEMPKSGDLVLSLLSGAAIGIIIDQDRMHNFGRQVSMEHLTDDWWSALR